MTASSQRKTRKVIVSDLVSVLHDAEIWGFSVVSKEGRAYFTATCLRLDHRELVPQDRRVICHFTGLGAVAIAYRTDLFTKPKEVAVSERFALIGTDLPFDVGGEVEAATGPALSSMLSDPSTHWVVGSARHIKGRKLISFNIQRGRLKATVLLWFRFFDAKVYAPLSMEDWKRQNNAWWKAWHRYHNRKFSSKPIDPRMDLAIPAGSSDDLATPSPDPPDEIEVAEAPAVPAWLLKAANAWACEEHRMGRRTGWESGSRPFLREVLDWWVAGKHAAIRLRGVEHYAWTDEQDDAAHDAVFELRFVRMGTRWCVSRQRSCRSRFFRPRLVGKPAWHRRWSGTIRY